MEALLIYIALLERIVLYSLPLLTIFLGFRRFLISRSFNRVFYLIAVVNALAALIALSRAAEADAILGILARVMAYGSLPVWFMVTDACRATASTEKYGDEWITVYRKREARLAKPVPPEIQRDPWANPPDSPALPAAPFIPSGRVAARIAVPGTA